MVAAENTPVVAGHLGGYLPGGDPATQFPELWDWLILEQGVATVLDVGCGDGVALRHFRSRGCYTVGVEGVPQNDPDIIQHDYTDGPLRVFAPCGDGMAHFNLCWCCEFVEHVQMRYVGNFLATFDCAELVLMTHATPSQPGYHHVNCQPREYWIDMLGQVGFDLDEQLTVRCRILAAQSDHLWNHFVRSGLAFVRRGTPPYRETA